MNEPTLVCPGCKKRVYLNKLDEHYKDGKHEAGVAVAEQGTTSNLPQGSADRASQQSTPGPVPRKPRLSDFLEEKTTVPRWVLVALSALFLIIGWLLHR